uniref:C2H2-type domain-containing protein n=1 Tax=Trichogramma kaykai TaxID=54128 RepID=A0ABD2WJF2_9HYME
METSGLFNPAVRFLQETWTQEFQENKLDDIQIKLECTDMKPNLLAVAKIEDYSPSQWPDSDDYKSRSTIKLETVGSVKKKILREGENDLNLGRGLSKKNKKKSVLKVMNYKHRLITHIESARNGNIKPTCDVCGKSFRCKSHLQRHIDSVHRKIRHACDICQKTFSNKSNIKTHIDSMHNGISHACDICRNVFKRRGDLKTHVDSRLVHCL